MPIRQSLNSYGLITKFKPGGWYYLPDAPSGAGQGAFPANQMRCTPFMVGRRVRFDQIGIHVLAAGLGGSTVRIGIYNDSGDHYPGALRLDAGTVTTDTTGVKNITIDQTLPPEMYWLAAVMQGGTTRPDIGVLGHNPAVKIAHSPPGGYTLCGYYTDAISGALPANWSATVGSVDWGPKIHLRTL